MFLKVDRRGHTWAEGPFLILFDESPSGEIRAIELAVHNVTRGIGGRVGREEAYAELVKDLRIAACEEGVEWGRIDEKAYRAFRREMGN